jgi:Zn-dependent M16 (insulinase) family peptidase
VQHKLALSAVPSAAATVSLAQQLDAACGANASAKRVSVEEVEALPLYVQLDDVKSDFIEIRLVLNTAPLTEEQRMYLEVYLEACYSVPIRRAAPDGSGTEEIGWESVVQELQDELVHYGNSLGFGGGNFSCGAFSQIVVLSLKSEAGVSRYCKAVSLTKEIACDTVFTPERLAVAANNLLNDVPEKKREGEYIALSALREVMYGPGSNHRACNLMRQQRFLTSLLTRLESDGDGVVGEMEAMRRVLTAPGGMMVQVIGNMQRLAQEAVHPLHPWVQAFASSAAPPTTAQWRVTQPGDVRLARELHTCAVGSPKGSLGVLGMAAMESCYLYATGTLLYVICHV